MGNRVGSIDTNTHLAPPLGSSSSLHCLHPSLKPSALAHDLWRRLATAAEKYNKEQQTRATLRVSILCGGCHGAVDRAGSGGDAGAAGGRGRRQPHLHDCAGRDDGSSEHE